MARDSTHGTPGQRRMAGLDADLAADERVRRLDSTTAPDLRPGRGGVRPDPPEGSDEWQDMPLDSRRGTPGARERGML